MQATTTEKSPETKYAHLTGFVAWPPTGTPMTEEQIEATRQALNIQAFCSELSSIPGKKTDQSTSR